MGRCISNGRNLESARLSCDGAEAGSPTASLRAAFSTNRWSLSWLRRTLVTVAVAAIVLVLSFFLLPWAANAGLSEGEAAVERGDFQAAYGELAPLAEDGVQQAQLLMALMLAEGKGIEQDYLLAMKWFLCAEKGSSPVSWSSRAAFARMQTESALTHEMYVRARDLAASKCGAGGATARSAKPAFYDLRTYRYATFDKAFFAPGDIAMGMAADVADEIGLPSFRSDIQRSYDNNSNYAFVAVLSGLLWIIWTVVALLVIDRCHRLPAVCLRYARLLRHSAQLLVFRARDSIQ